MPGASLRRASRICQVIETALSHFSAQDSVCVLGVFQSNEEFDAAFKPDSRGQLPCVIALDLRFDAGCLQNTLRQAGVEAVQKRSNDNQLGLRLDIPRSILPWRIRR